MKAPTNQPDLTLVIPAYREEKRIPKTFDILANFLDHDSYFAKKHVEVLVVSASAGDRTHEIVEANARRFRDFTFIKPGPHAGKGRDVRAGMLAARGKVILFMDADLSTPLHHVKSFYNYYLQGAADVIIGTRGTHRYGHSLLRLIISNLGNVAYRLVGGVWVEDSQCGFKLFSNKAAKVCFSKLKIIGWGFDMEVLTAAKANHFSIKTIPIDDWQAMPEGTFDNNVAKNTLRSLFDLGTILSRRISGYYRSSSDRSKGLGP